MALIPEHVVIWRAPDGDYHIEWQASDPATRVTVEPVDVDPAVRAQYHTTPSPRAQISGLPLGCRHFFKLRDQLGNEVLATERRLGLEGTPNFRDFGGYHTADGQHVKWGYMFRSGHLAKLTEADLGLMATLKLDLLCDFRQTEEQLSEPNRLPAQNPPVLCSLPIAPGDNSGFLERIDGPLDGPQPMFDFMVAVNEEFVEGQAATYARMFAAIMERENARFLVHCAAGKDRTGFAAAIILLSLGVPEDTVMRDYLLSRQFYDAPAQLKRAQIKYRLAASTTDAVLPMLEVHPEYLSAALTAIQRRYGNFNVYLREALGIGPAELAELRGRYLTD